MKRVLVTGANRGLGLEFVRQLLDRGDHVYATCRKPGQALPLTKLAAAHPGHLQVLPLDVTSERSVAELVREVSALTESLDVLINNAGVLVSGERFGKLGADVPAKSFACNVIGPLLLTQALCGLLEHGGGARVMNLTSRMGSITEKSSFNSPSYSISKAALNMVTRLLALELSPRGVIVFCIHPGWVLTDMGGAQAQLTPAESVGAMLQVLDNVGADDSGRFVDRNGDSIAW